MPLLIVCFWLPAFIGPLCGIPAYLLVRKVTNEYGGFVAGILAVTAPFYFIRTVSGWFDTDMFNILFPLLIMFFFFEAIQNENKKKSIFFAFLSAFSMLLFAMAWNGWQYLFYIIVLFCILYIIFGKIKGIEVKNYFHVFITFFTVTLLLVSIASFSNLLNFVFAPIELLKLSSSYGPWYPWPNLYISVSELQNPSIEEVINGVSPITFFLGIFSIFLIFKVLYTKNLKERFLKQLNWFLYLLLVFWTIAGFIALTKGARFIILLIPPLIISAGIMIGIFIDYISSLKIKDILVKFLCLGIVIRVTSILPFTSNSKDFIK
jgi:dolichyl-diphosphooligosaccharide--protein glycosyltransferase